MDSLELRKIEDAKRYADRYFERIRSKQLNMV